MRHRLVSTLLPLLTAGCLVGRQMVNEPLDPGAIARLQPGTTTASEVLELLGAPSDVVQIGRRSAWRYDHSVEKSAAIWIVVFASFSTDLRQDRAWLFFDENATLTHLGATLAGHRPQYSLVWEDVYEAEDAASRDRTRFGEARR